MLTLSWFANGGESHLAGQRSGSVPEGSDVQAELEPVAALRLDTSLLVGTAGEDVAAVEIGITTRVWQVRSTSMPSSSSTDK